MLISYSFILCYIGDKGNPLGPFRQRTHDDSKFQFEPHLQQQELLSQQEKKCIFRLTD